MGRDSGNYALKNNNCDACNETGVACDEHCEHWEVSSYICDDCGEEMQIPCTLPDND